MAYKQKLDGTEKAILGAGCVIVTFWVLFYLAIIVGVVAGVKLLVEAAF